MKKLLFVVLIALGACSGESRTDECSTDDCLKQQAYDRVMVVHDEVMPKLATVKDLKGKIEERMKSSLDSATTNEFIRLVQDLEAANESMWVWMRAFNAEIKKAPLDSALNYLNVEQEKVNKVAEQINASIAAAQAALD